MKAKKIMPQDIIDKLGRESRKNEDTLYPLSPPAEGEIWLSFSGEDMDTLPCYILESGDNLVVAPISTEINLAGVLDFMVPVPELNPGLVMIEIWASLRIPEGMMNVRIARLDDDLAAKISDLLDIYLGDRAIPDNIAICCGDNQDIFGSPSWLHRNHELTRLELFFGDAMERVEPIITAQVEPTTKTLPTSEILGAIDKFLTLLQNVFDATPLPVAARGKSERLIRVIRLPQGSWDTSAIKSWLKQKSITDNQRGFGRLETIAGLPDGSASVQWRLDDALGGLPRQSRFNVLDVETGKFIGEGAVNGESRVATLESGSWGDFVSLIDNDSSLLLLIV